MSSTFFSVNKHPPSVNENIFENLFSSEITRFLQPKSTSAQKNQKIVAICPKIRHTFVMPKIYDTNALEFDYVTKGLSCDDLCEKYGIKIRTVHYHCSKRDWVNKRKMVRMAHINPAKAIELTVKETANGTLSLADSLELLAKKKMGLEFEAIGLSTGSLKDLQTTLNKSKDGISELIKTSELLRGNPTENILVDNKERDERISRLRRMAGDLSAN